MKEASFYIGQEVRKRQHGLGKANCCGTVQEVIPPSKKLRMWSYKVLLNGSDRPDIVNQNRLEATSSHA